MTRWVRWADARANAHMARTSTCVAPEWLYARSPAIGLQMLIGGALRRFARKY